MSKLILFALLLTTTITPSFAQQDPLVEKREFTAAQGDPGTGWADMDQFRTSDVTMTKSNDPKYFLVKPPDNTHTQRTTQNGYQQGLPLMPTVSSMPYVNDQGGAGDATIETRVQVQDTNPDGSLKYDANGNPVWKTDQYGNVIFQDVITQAPATMNFGGAYMAPGNFAARQWGGGVLWPTRLDSIVATSGYNFMVFGDEGTDGPPPLDDFGTIDSGVTATTGHPSDAPSAWGFPN